MRKARIVAMALALALLAGLLAGAAPDPSAGFGRPQAVTVTVTGAAGAPVAEARVELIVPGRGIVAEAMADRQGRARLAPAEAAITYWLRVWGANHTTVDRPWVPAADSNSLAVELQPLAGSLTGLVLDHLGLPVSGARVSAWRPGFGLAGETASGEGGVYVLRGLTAPGPYQIQVTATGFRAFAAPPQAVAAGQEQRLDIPLAPATGSVRGDVADARAGAGLVGARVELLRKGWGILAATTTNAAGAFTLTAPAADAADYQVRIWAEGYSLITTAPFALPPGSRRDFTGAERLLAQPRTGAVWGVLVDDKGTPMADAPVELQLLGAGTVGQTTSDADGFFAFAGHENGAYRVRAFPGSGWTPVDSPWVSLIPGGGRYVELAGLKYVRLFYDHGTVAGTVTDPNGVPVGGARLSLIRGDETIASGATDARGRYRIAEVPANRAKDLLRPLLTGYAIRVEQNGYWPTDQPATAATGIATPGVIPGATAATPATSAASGQAPATGAAAPAAVAGSTLPLLTTVTAPPPTFVDVTQDRVVQIDFVLRPQTGALAGAVLDDQGEPLPGAAVSLFRDGAGGTPVASATAGPDGAYRFDDVPLPLTGGYTVSAQATGYFPATATGLLDPALAPGARGNITLRLRPATARIQGRAAGALGAGVGAATVTALHPATGRSWAALTDNGGWFRLDQLPAGPTDTLVVRGAASDLRATAAEGAVILAGARARTVNLQFASAAAVSGSIFGPQGEPAAGATVELWHEGDTQATDSTTANAVGAYHFAGLVPGDRYTVRAWLEGAPASVLTPGEVVITPLFVAAAGQVTQCDVALASAQQP